MKRPQNHPPAGALVSTLVFAAISVTMVSAVGMIMVSHVSRSRAEAQYVGALYLAEQALSHELKWIEGDPFNPNRAHQKHPEAGQPGPLEVQLPHGSFKVAVTNLDGTGPWVAGHPIRLEATGISRGISRTIEAKAYPDSVIGSSLAVDQFTIFARKSVTISGSGSKAVRAVGTNGTYTATQGASAVDGAVLFCGVNPSVTGANVYRESGKRSFPTVDDIVTEEFGSWAWIKANNDNDKIKRFKLSLGVLNNTVLAGFKKTSYTMTNATFHVTGELYNMNTLDKPKSQGGTRYATQNQGLYNKLVLIFPPGDYYFENWGLTYDYKAILVDNANGPVRIWIGGNGSSNDSWQSPTFLTNPNDPGSFRVYYGKNKTLTVSGTAAMPGLFYGVNNSANSAIVASGGTVITGAIFGERVTISSGTKEKTTVGYPAEVTLGLTSDPGNRFVMRGGWREIGSVGSAFTDGTSY